MELLTILLIILGIAVVWTLLKFALKITTKIFSCGCGIIILIGLFLLFLGYIDLATLLK